MTDEQILKIVKTDYETAKKAKQGIDKKMATWVDEYNGEPYGNESDGHSQVVVKDIKKAVEWFLPNAVEPFVSKGRIVKLSGITADDVKRASITEKLLNYQFVRAFDRYNFIYDCFKVGATEGTTVVKCGWDFKEEVKVEKLDFITPEQAMQLQADGIEIEVNEDGSAKLTKRKTVKNKPTARVIKNGNFFIDPTADSIDTASWCIEVEDVTLSSLQESGIYDNLDNISSSDREYNSSNMEIARNNVGEDRGFNTRDYESDSKSLKKVTKYEYWGDLDIDDSGIAKPWVVTWVGNTIIRNEENPYPDKEKPYIATPFTKTPFMFWGDALAEFISDGQFIRSGIMRAMLDNVAQSNNGFKFFRKGALDPLNKKKLQSGIGGNIEVNGDSNDMWDGNFNQMPQTIFNMFEMIQRENESLSGISNIAQGLDSRALNSATASSIASSSGQKRMMEIIRRYSELIKQLMRKWISYNKMYLSDKEVIRISGEYIEFTLDDIDGAYDIDITVGVDGVEENKANQMTMLMQQIGGLAGNVDPSIVHDLLAKLSDIWGFPDIAQKLEQYQQPEPDPMQQEMAQLEMEKLKAEIEKLKSEAHENMSDANAKNVSAKMNAYGITNKAN